MAIEDTLKALDDFDKQDLDLSVSSAVRQSPDESAKVYNLSREKGLPFDYVRRNIDKASAPDLSNAGPSVAQLLRDRKKAAISIDDIDNLSWWETAGREAGNIANLVPAAAKSISSAGYSVLGSAFNSLSDLSLAPVRSLNLATEQEIKDGDFLGAAGKYLMEIAGEERARVDSFMPKKTVMHEAVVGGIKSALVNLPAMAAGVISRSPSVAMGSMGGFTYGDSYLTAKNSGLDEMAAVSYASNQAIAEMVTERIPLNRLLGDLNANAGFVKTVANQMAREIPGEQVATIWQDALDWAALNPDKTVGEFLSERPDAAVNTLISTVVAAGLQTSAVYGIDRLGRQKELETVQEISDMANASKVRGRALDVFEEHINNITEEYGSPDAVYIDAKEARPLFQSMSQDAAYQLLADQIDEAEAVGGDIVIPMAQFASTVATSKNFESIKGIVRLSVDSPTNAQMADQEGRISSILLEAGKNVEAKTRADEIYKEVTKQLINTGRMNADVAKTSAAIIPAYVTTKAVRSGLSVDEVYGMMGLTVQKEDATNDIGLKQNSLKEWDAILAGLDYAQTKPQQGQDDATEFLSNAPAGTRYTDESKLLKRIRKSSDQAFNELSGSPEAGRVGKTSLGQFSAYRTQADIIEPDSLYPDGRIEVQVFGKEQDEQGLNEEPALTFTVSKDGELSVNGPTGETFDSFKGAGWAKESTGKDGETQSGWTSLVNKDGSQMPLSQLLPLIADVHARVRAWRGDDKIGLHWSRSTGATGGIVGGRQTSVFFQDKKAPSDQASEPKDLYVFHNLSEANLQYADELGGLAAPSLGVGRADVTTPSNFGEITLLGAPSLLEDPAARTFDADIYTPRQPKAEIQVSREKYKALIESLATSAGFVDGLKLPDSDLIRDNGINELLRSEAMRIALLDSKGIAVPRKKVQAEPLVKQAAKIEGTRWQLEENEKVKKLAEKFYRDEIEKVKVADPEMVDEITNIYFYEDGELKNNYLSKFVYKATQYRTSGGVDLSALRDDIGKKFRNEKLESEFKKFAAEKLNEIAEGKNLFKGFTNAGDRKYVAYTLSNVVKEMTQKLQGGEDYFYGHGSIRSAYASELKTIKEVQSRRSDIVSNEDMMRVKQEADGKLTDALDALAKFYKFDSDSFGYGEDAGRAIAEGPKGWSEAFKITPESKKIITDLVSYLKNLPTEYFENKMQRAVGLQEFKAAIVPSNVSAETLELLRKNGITDVRKYKKGDDADRNAKIKKSKELLFQNNGEARGSYDPSTGIIKLGEASDLSTFLHEAGHLFLEMESRLFNHPNATEEMKADGKVILDWLGLESFDQLKNYETDPASREAHEKFARGFEKYLGEGKAPSVELKSVFRRFAAWMKQVYRDLTNLNVELTDDVRAVMDRMLATDEQINRLAKGFEPLFKSAEDAGMTEPEFKQYSHEASPDSAKEALQSKMIKQLTRHYTKWWKDESVSIAKNVIKQVETQPLYSALGYIKASDQNKLNRDAVRSYFPDGMPKKFNGLTAEGGMMPDDMAAIHGLPSGAELIDLIATEPTLNAKVKELTEIEMVRRHGDILNDGTIQEEAAQAMHNPEQAKKLVAELGALSRKTGKSTIDREAAKQYAKETIGKMAFSKIRPAQYRSAELRAAREAVAAKLKGDMAGAQKAKEQELVNFYLSKEAQAAKEKAEKIRASQRAIQIRKYTSANVNTDYVNEAKVLLSAYDFRKNSDDSVELAKAKISSVRNWIESQQKDPNSVSTFVQAEVLGKLIPYSEMTLDDLQGLNDVVNSIIHAGRKISEEERVEYKQNIETGKSSIVDNRIDTYQTEADSNIPWVKAKSLFNEASASLRKFESLARQADGLNDQGWVWRNTIKPLLGAANEKLKMQKKAHEELNEIFHGFNDVFSTLKSYKTNPYNTLVDFKTDSGGVIRLSYGGRISLALNLGNDGNLDALKTMNSLPLTDADIARITSTLEERDWQLVQSIWDYVDSYWPEIAKLEIKRSGVAPQKVLPREFITPSGIEMRGGYYPLAGDPAEDMKQMDQDIDTMANAMMNGGASAKSTKHGSTIERVGFGGKKIDFSIGVLFNHIDGVIHDLTHWQAVKDVDRILKNEKISSELSVSLGRPGTKAMKQRLKEIAAGPQRIEGLGWVNRTLRHARLASTYSALGYSVRTAMMNMMGFTTAVADMTPQQVARGAVEYYSNIVKANEMILSKSEYMRDRGAVLNRDIAQIKAKMRADTALTKFQDGAFWMMTQTDKAITRPIWLAAYREGEMKFDTEKEAIDHADRMVARTQGSGMDLDLATVETKNEAYKTLTVMYTAFSAIYNIAVEQTKRYKAGKISATGLALRLSWLTVVPGILTSLLTGSDDDEPEDMLMEIAGQGLGMIPIARDAFSYARYGASFPTPILRLATAPVKLANQAAQGEVDKGLIGAAAEVASWAHIPGGAQLTRTYGYISDMQDGEIEEFSPIDLLITGKE